MDSVTVVHVFLFTLTIRKLRAKFGLFLATGSFGTLLSSNLFFLVAPNFVLSFFFCADFPILYLEGSPHVYITQCPTIMQLYKPYQISFETRQIQKYLELELMAFHIFFKVHFQILRVCKKPFLPLMNL